MANGHKQADVWHCSLSLRAEEGALTDQQWGDIANDFVDAMGFTEASGKAECRWVAINHGTSENGNHHIHVAVSLVREDGTKALRQPGRTLDGEPSAWGLSVRWQLS